SRVLVLGRVLWVGLVGFQSLCSDAELLEIRSDKNEAAKLAFPESLVEQAHRAERFRHRDEPFACLNEVITIRLGNQSYGRCRLLQRFRLGTDLLEVRSNKNEAAKLAFPEPLVEQAHRAERFRHRDKPFACLNEIITIRLANQNYGTCRLLQRFRSGTDLLEVRSDKNEAAKLTFA